MLKQFYLNFNSCKVRYKPPPNLTFLFKFHKFQFLQGKVQTISLTYAVKKHCINFNSCKVRYKLIILNTIRYRNKNFNSCKVRYKRIR
ncbi:hypothetical protein THA_861 [Thermosipho africanus TCF52B]|uniref:Uncharacterized protein n=1 Tax=Thermosipho africanus (strain TCF52B) TaxID=484019 RepID=B7IGV7_THEAB|nr:hypothetical protein THA_861 [Thermosipho africanus TCF52B]